MLELYLLLHKRVLQFWVLSRLGLLDISDLNLSCPKFGLSKVSTIQNQSPLTNQSLLSRCLCQLDRPIGLLNQSHHPQPSQCEHGESQGQLIALHSLPAKVSFGYGRASAKSHNPIATLSEQSFRWLPSSDYNQMILWSFISTKTKSSLTKFPLQDPVFISNGSPTSRQSNTLS